MYLHSATRYHSIQVELVIARTRNGVFDVQFPELPRCAHVDEDHFDVLGVDGVQHVRRGKQQDSPCKRCMGWGAAERIGGDG